MRPCYRARQRINSINALSSCSLRYTLAFLMCSNVRRTGAPLPDSCAPTEWRPVVYQVDWSEVKNTVLSIIPPLSDNSAHKGQHGRIAVVGGSEQYTGAPYFAGQAALVFGADLVSVFCANEASIPIKSYSPDLMVTPLYSASSSTLEDSAVEFLQRSLERTHAMVLGPGLGRSVAAFEVFARILSLESLRDLPVVIDADGIYICSLRLDLLRGLRRAVLTPNINEFKMLVTSVLKDEGSDGFLRNSDIKPTLESFLASASSHVRAADLAPVVHALSKALGGMTIFLKGVDDIVACSELALIIQRGSDISPRRCGGQGDIFAGALTTAMFWASKFSMSVEVVTNSSLNPAHDREYLPQLKAHPALLACVLASKVTSKASFKAFAKHGRGTTTSLILSEMGPAFEDISPSVYT